MDQNLEQDLAAPVRTMQIIVFAVTMGPLMFLAIVCVIAQGGMRNAFDALPPLTLVGLGLAATMIVARLVIVQAMTAGARRAIGRDVSDVGGGQTSAVLPDHDGRQLVTIYQTRLIVGAAMLEGAAFFLLIAYMIERSPWSLVAAIVMILGVAMHFPTTHRVAGWIEEQMSRSEV